MTTERLSGLHAAEAEAARTLVPGQQRTCLDSNAAAQRRGDRTNGVILEGALRDAYDAGASGCLHDLVWDLHGTQDNPAVRVLRQGDELADASGAAVILASAFLHSLQGRPSVQTRGSANVGVPERGHTHICEHGPSQQECQPHP